VHKNYTELSEEDSKSVGRILYGWLLLNLMISRYKPKKYAHEVLVKKSRSEKRLAFTRLLFDALLGEGRQLKRAGGRSPITPIEVNEMLAREMEDGITRDLTDMQATIDGFPGFKEYITSSDMTWVLGNLVRVGVYLNSRAAPTEKSKPGRRPLHDRPAHELGGRDSYYQITREFQELTQVVLAKAEVRAAVYDALLNSKLIFKYVMFMTLARHYAVMEDPSFLRRIMRATNVPLVEESLLESYRYKVSSLSSTDLYRAANQEARWRIKQGFYRDNATFLLGLFAHIHEQ
jgi:hypothetical protein